MPREMRMKYYQSIRYGHLYIVIGDDVVLVLNGTPVISTLSKEYIEDHEHIKFKRVEAIEASEL